MPFISTIAQYGPFRRTINLLGLILIVALAHSTVAAAQAEDGKTLIFAFGDSLTAGYGLAPGDGFTGQLEDALNAAGAKVKVVNAGVSGDTSTAGLARLDWVLDALPHTPDLAIIELGANDGLRGVDPAITRKNIEAIIQRLQAKDIPVLLTGMLAPPNLGSEYEAEFNPIFPDLAERYDTAFYPFFLDGVAADASLNQSDGIHPNAQGVAIIVENMLPDILSLITPQSRAP